MAIDSAINSIAGGEYANKKFLGNPKALRLKNLGIDPQRPGNQYIEISIAPEFMTGLSLDLNALQERVNSDNHILIENYAARIEVSESMNIYLSLCKDFKKIELTTH